LIVFVFILLAGCGTAANDQEQASPDFDLQEFQNEAADTADEPDIGADGIEQGDKDIYNDIYELVGTWHDSPGMASLMTQRYHFFEDSTYIFETSQFDGTRRVLSESGTWEYKNDILTLTITGRIIVEGGEEKESMILVGDALDGGTIRIIEVDPPEIEEYLLEDFYFDDVESIGRTTVMIGETRFWKFADDPEQDMNEPVKDGDLYSSYGV